MSKKRNRGRRDFSNYRYPRRMPLHSVYAPSGLLSSLRLLPGGDSRFFFPSLSRPFVSAPRSASRLVARSATKIGFADPRRVVVCLRRGIRKEVLHALGVAGGRVGRGHRGPASGISCK